VARHAERLADQQAGRDDRHDDREQMLERGDERDHRRRAVVRAVDEVAGRFCVVGAVGGGLGVGGGLHGERAGQDGKCGILAEGPDGAGADRRYSGRAAAYGTRAASDTAGCWRARPSGGPAVAGSPPAPRSLPAQHARHAAPLPPPIGKRRICSGAASARSFDGSPRRARRIVQPDPGAATPPEAR